MKKGYMRRVLVALCLLALMALLAGCATANPMLNVPAPDTHTVYGFLNGLWDGLTALFAFVGDLFGAHQAIYQVHNDGNLYDLGFLLGIGAFGGIIGLLTGAGSSRR